MKLEQQIIELELELPRRATDYEYAAWQVKDQLRQARGIETRLSLNVPSTEETRQLQHRVAQIRVFLEQVSGCLNLVRLFHICANFTLVYKHKECSA